MSEGEMVKSTCHQGLQKRLLSPARWSGGAVSGSCPFSDSSSATSANLS